MRILNLGCGDDTYGTDFVDLYPSRNGVIKCDVDNEKIPFRSNMFDVVYLNNLFEHLTNAGFVMKEIYRVLKKGGRVIIITDNASYWGYVSSLSGVHEGEYERIREGQGITQDRHYALFTDCHLYNYARKFNFRNPKVIYLKDKNRGRGLKDIIRIIISRIFQCGPFWKMGYNRMKLIAKK